MPSQNPQENTQHEPSETDPAASGENATLPAAPPLNREQRRAQAKGKKGASPGFHPSNTNTMRGGGRPANAPIQNKIPRTGHK